MPNAFNFDVKKANIVLMRKLRNSELNRLTVDEFKSAEKFPINVILDDVRSHHNVGSIFRTCDALKINRLILGGITPVPPSPEIEKTALGASSSVDWEHRLNISEFIRENRKDLGEIVGLEHTTESRSILQRKINTDQVVTLVFGNEVKGIQAEVLALCDEILEIPQFGTKHSFNVSVSAGIAIWEVAKHFMK